MPRDPKPRGTKGRAAALPRRTRDQFGRFVSKKRTAPKAPPRVRDSAGHFVKTPKLEPATTHGEAKKPGEQRTRYVLDIDPRTSIKDKIRELRRLTAEAKKRERAKGHKIVGANWRVAGTGKVIFGSPKKGRKEGEPSRAKVYDYGSFQRDPNDARDEAENYLRALDEHAFAEHGLERPWGTIHEMKPKQLAISIVWTGDDESDDEEPGDEEEGDE